MLIDETASSFRYDNFHVFIENLGVENGLFESGKEESGNPVSENERLKNNTKNVPGKNLLLGVRARLNPPFDDSFASPKTLVRFRSSHSNNWIVLMLNLHVSCRIPGVPCGGRPKVGRTCVFKTSKRVLWMENSMKGQPTDSERV